MRGTPATGSRQANSRGIIPAHAGNTQQDTNPSSQSWDHPRTCGEHWCEDKRSDTVKGSSPHMRGTPRLSSPSSVPVGIIPAHAGNTKDATTDTAADGDHPRTCGEHALSAANPGQMVGSSPHMRGTRRGFSIVFDPPRIIPAHAGNTGDNTPLPGIA